MCLLRTATICATLFVVSLGQQLIVIGPRFFHSNRSYNLTIFNMGNTTATLQVILECPAENKTFNVTRNVNVETKELKPVEFKIPKQSKENSIIRILWTNGTLIKEEEIQYQAMSISGLIQLSKPVYKPGDSVQFRVIVLDSDLKPPADLKNVTVIVQNSVGNNIRKWSNVLLYNGVFEGQLDIAPSPHLGEYNIEVEANDEKLVSKQFTVKEYVLSTFEVNVFPTVIPLEEHQALNLTIEAKYYFGTPANGTARIQFTTEDNKLIDKSFDILNGKQQVHFPLNKDFTLFDDRENLTLKVTFIEQHTNRTVDVEPRITVYKHKYRVRFIGNPVFKNQSANYFQLAVTYQDGSPAEGVLIEVTIDLDYTERTDSYKSDSEGIISLAAVNTTSGTETISIAASFNNDELLSKILRKASTHYFKIRNIPKLRLGHSLTLSLLSLHKMSYVLYYIISNGNLVHFASESVNKRTRDIQLPPKVTNNMIPRANILVATVINNTFLYDIVTIDSEQMTNNIQLMPKDHIYDLRPDNTIELLISGPPNAYVALAAYDRSLLQHGQTHDISREDVLKLFPPPEATASFDRIGLFVHVNELKMEDVEDKSTRTDNSPTHGQSKKLHAFRSEFFESWLWENITLLENGTYTLMRPTPDITTSWYLTGFSVDPVKGFGIIQKPMLLTTNLSFYIVDNLPYSIRRGEAVALQFTLFNNLNSSCNATVTMYVTKDQYEFVGQPIGAKNQTKSVQVLPTAGTPVTFLVKAKTLGEMTVLVEASTMQGEKVDAIERHVRILPENLIMNYTTTRFFWHDTDKSSFYAWSLDIDNHAVPGSVQVNFTIAPNLVSKVSQNLENLLEIPANTGDQSMIHFGPSLAILEYEEAMRTKDSDIYKKAEKQLRIGYQNLLKFYGSDGSFGVWQQKGGSVFVTAFVAQCIKRAEKYSPVEQDKTIVSNALEWLASKQQTNGSFVEIGPIVYNDMQANDRNGIALTSFVMVAFMKMQTVENKYQAIIEKGMAYIADHWNRTANSFDLSIATYALHLNNHQNKTSAFDKLVTSSKTNILVQRFWNTSTSQIETAVFALLSLIEANRIDLGIEVMRWLVNQTYEKGSFHHSFDTTFGLMAITKLNTLITTERNDYDIKLNYSSVRKEFHFSSKDTSPQTFLIATTRVTKINSTISGIGTGLMQISSKYEMKLEDFANRFQLTLNKLSSTSATELKLRICSKYKAEVMATSSNLALVEVNLPSGYVVYDNPISNATGFNPIQDIEILYGATTVVLHYEKMDNTYNCFTITAHRVFNVVFRSPAYVKVQDVYNPVHNAIKSYKVDKQHLCEICSKQDCTNSCGDYVS